ncbi:MAG: hypothetical protein JNM25_11790 [Planctomycetes bacterium]|nr:hypothetical protein [Planctomycetota bacterium]
MLTVPLVFALALSAPQAPPAKLPDLPALAARVDAAHRPNGPVPAVTAFRCNLTLSLLDRDASQAGDVVLDVQFLQWRKPGSDRVRPLIRYKVQEAGSPSERGRDQNGPWHLFQGEAQDLRKAQFADDLAACERHTNLARQLLRFLDPGEVLRSLTHPSAVRAENLAVERSKLVPCLTVEGDLPAFPLLQQGGDDAPVRLKVFVEQATGRLLAIEASPLRDGVPDPARLEQVLLLDLDQRDGLLVPRKIVHRFRRADGQLHAQTRATLTSLELRPPLSVEDFDRPQ